MLTAVGLTLISAAIGPLSARLILHEQGLSARSNVPSELRRPKPDPRVTRWLQSENDDLLYLSVISIGEFCKGITVHPEQRRRADLQRWLDAVLRLVCGPCSTCERCDWGKVGHP